MRGCRCCVYVRLLKTCECVVLLAVRTESGVRCCLLGNLAARLHSVWLRVRKARCDMLSTAQVCGGLRRQTIFLWQCIWQCT
jgi:hypothetical protein